MPDERYTLIDAAGFGLRLPGNAKPNALQPRRPKVNLQRARNSPSYLRLDDGLGNLEALRLEWVERADSETILSYRLLTYRNQCAVAAWLARADRAVMAVKAATVDAVPIDGPSRTAKVTLDVYGVTGAFNDQNGLEVFF